MAKATGVLLFPFPFRQEIRIFSKPVSGFMRFVRLQNRRKVKTMLFRHSIRQVFRTPVRTLAYLAVMAMACAFFTIGLNLRQSAKANIQAIYDSFDVIATPRLTAPVDWFGALTGITDPDYVGTFPAETDLPVLEALYDQPQVSSVDVRNQFGAYVADELVTDATLGQSDYYYYDETEVVIFRYKGSEPLTVPGLKYERWADTDPSGQVVYKYERGAYIRFPAEVLYSAFGRAEYGTTLAISNCITAEELRPQEWDDFRYTPDFPMGTRGEDGLLDGGFVLEPGKTYILLAEGVVSAGRFQTTGLLDVLRIEISNNRYLNSGGRMVRDADGQFARLYYLSNDFYAPIAEYTEDFWDTERGDFFRQAAEVSAINSRSLTAITTSDMNAMLPFSTGDVFISQGRGLTEEDHAAGAKVCLVSQTLADVNQWQIGDTLDFQFFRSDYPMNDTVVAHESLYYADLFEDRAKLFRNPVGGSRFSGTAMDDFFDSGTYTIVGFYGGQVTLCGAALNNNYFYNRLEGFDRHMVILPTSSVHNTPPPLQSEYSVSIRLDPFGAQDYLADIKAQGLLGQQENGITVDLTVYDKGLTKILPGLRRLEQISDLLFLLALTVTVLTVLVLAVLQVWQKSREMAVLRSLGTSRGKAMALLLTGLLLVSLIGAALGAAMGGLLSDRLVTQILDTAAQQAPITAFEPTGDSAKEEPFVFQGGGGWTTAAMACGIQTVAFTVLLMVLFRREANRPPLTCLGTKE